MIGLLWRGERRGRPMKDMLEKTYRSSIKRQFSYRKMIIESSSTEKRYSIREDNVDRSSIKRRQFLGFFIEIRASRDFR